MTDAPPSGSPPRPREPTGRWVARVIYLLLLALVTILMLTSAQISYAYLSASGGDGAVSAIAIRDTARFYQDNRRARMEVLDAIAEQQSRRVRALNLVSDASLFEYFHKVQFRRFIFGCYPAAYAAVKTARGKDSASGNELGWDFLLAVYQEASKPVAAGATPEVCTAAVRQNQAAVDQLKRSQDFDYGPLFDDCSTARSGQSRPSSRERLECLWDNVTNSVGLEELAQKHSAALDVELQARRGSVGSLDDELAGDRALANPTGRAAVAAWLALHGPFDVTCKTDEGRGCRAAGPRDLAVAKPAIQLAPATSPSGTGQLAGASQPPASAPKADAPKTNALDGQSKPTIGEAARAVARWIARLPSQAVALIATMPILAQSAVMAMAAGALGGGVACMWTLLGYRRTEPKEIRDAAAEAQSALADVSQATSGAADAETRDALAVADARIGELATTLREASAALAAHADRSTGGDSAPVAVATFCGAVSALILWLLTTSGLFVLTGGDNAATASPNVLLALALMAGLTYARVIDLIFSIAEGALRPRT